MSFLYVYFFLTKLQVFVFESLAVTIPVTILFFEKGFLNYAKFFLPIPWTLGGVCSKPLGVGIFIAFTGLWKPKSPNFWLVGSKHAVGLKLCPNGSPKGFAPRPGEVGGLWMFLESLLFPSMAAFSSSIVLKLCFSHSNGYRYFMYLKKKEFFKNSQKSFRFKNVWIHRIAGF